MKRSTLRSASLLLLIGAGAVSGCSGSGGDAGPSNAASENSSSTADSVTPATFEGDGSGGDDALIEGVLRLEQECVYIDVGGGELVSLAFPAGLDPLVSDDTLTLGQHDFNNGEQARFRGGESAPAAFLDSACKGADTWYLARPAE